MTKRHQKRWSALLYSSTQYGETKAGSDCCCKIATEKMQRKIKMEKKQLWACCCLAAGKEINIDVYVVCSIIYVTFRVTEDLSRFTWMCRGGWRCGPSSHGGTPEDTVINTLYRAGRREGPEPIWSHRVPVGVSAVYFTGSEKSENECDRQPIWALFQINMRNNPNGLKKCSIWQGALVRMAQCH